MTTEGSFQAMRGLSASAHSLLSLPLTASSSPTSVLSTATTSTTSSSYDLESQVGQEVVAKICYSALSRILEFPDGKFEALIASEGAGSGADSQRSIAQNIRNTLKQARRSLEVHTHPSSHRWERLHEGGRRTWGGEDEVGECRGKESVSFVTACIMRVSMLNTSLINPHVSCTMRLQRVLRNICTILSAPLSVSDGDDVQCESGLKGPLGPTILRLIGHMESSEGGRS